MFLAELGFLQQKKYINTKFYLNLLFFIHPGNILLGFPVHYNLLWYGFPTLFLSHISMFLAGLSTPTLSRIFSSIAPIHVWLAFLRMLNGVSSSWMAAFLMFHCLPGLKFCQISNFLVFVVSSLGVFPKMVERGLSIVHKLWGSSLVLWFLLSKTKLVYKKATNAISDCQVGYHSLRF